MCDKCRLGKHRECVLGACDCWHHEEDRWAARFAAAEAQILHTLAVDPDQVLDLVNDMKRWHDGD